MTHNSIFEKDRQIECEVLESNQHSVQSLDCFLSFSQNYSYDYEPFKNRLTSWLMCEHTSKLNDKVTDIRTAYLLHSFKNKISKNHSQQIHRRIPAAHFYNGFLEKYNSTKTYFNLSVFEHTSNDLEYRIRELEKSNSILVNQLETALKEYLSSVKSTKKRYYLDIAQLIVFCIASLVTALYLLY